MRLLALGLKYKEIAVKTALSESGVKYHMSKIIERLHLKNRAQAVAFAGKMSMRGRSEKGK